MDAIERDLGHLPVRRGKVRDVYEIGGDRLLIVATDRISAHDWILPTLIPDKGRILSAMTLFWFRRLDVRNHFLSIDLDEVGVDLSPEAREALRGRSMIVRKARVIPCECVVRGYISGSAWREYREAGTIAGQAYPEGLVESQAIQPAFTPATKEESGHDRNISLAEMAEMFGSDLSHVLEERSKHLFEVATTVATAQGLILADTKFEWGFDPRNDELLLIDEALTPDSSRYWPAENYAPGGPQPSFDKQYVRDWLDASGWDRQSPPPPLPEDVVARTREKYAECYRIITGHDFDAN